MYNTLAYEATAATTGGLDAILRPRAIAVVGVSDREDSLGHRVVEHLVNGGFNGPILPVGPHAETVCGLPVARSLASAGSQVPWGVIDLAVIAVDASRVVEVAEECIAAQVGGLIVVSSGFAETDSIGRTRQNELRDIARAAGMRVVGPNCLGAISPRPETSMWAVFADVPMRPGSIALMSQSGAVGMAVAAAAYRSGLGFSSFLSVGNKADVSGNDLLEYWENDPHTSVIALYLESFGNPQKFGRIARRVGRTKPIVVLKAGRTSVGARAAGSHSAALAQPDDTVDALFAQARVTRVDDLSSLLHVSQALAVLPLPAGRSVAVIGNAGGLGILAADALASHGCLLAELTPDSLVSLRAELPSNATVGNPTDLTAAVTAEEFGACLRVVLGDPHVDAVLTVHAAIGAEADAIEDTVAVLAMNSAKPVVSVRSSSTGVASHDESRVVVEMPEDGALVLAKLAERAEWPANQPQPVCPIDSSTITEIQTMVREAQFARPEGGWVDPVRAFAIVSAAGISVASPVFVDGDDDAALAAARLGFPVSLKAANPALVHRSDRNAIRLGLGDEFNVTCAFDAIAKDLRDEMGGAIVQPMVAPGVEMIVGVTNDPRFGPLLLIGAGGREAELWKDTTLHLAPLEEGDARRMIAGLKCVRLLEGFRNSPPSDIDSLVDAVERLGHLAVAVPEIAELDINPLIVHGRGAVAVDVKIRLAPLGERIWT